MNVPKVFIPINYYEMCMIESQVLEYKKSGLYEVTLGNTKIMVRMNDITKESTEAIVVGSNQKLIHDGGLAGLVLKAAGEEMQTEINQIISDVGYIPFGSCVATTAGAITNFKKVIHTVGPVYYKISKWCSKMLL